MNKLIKILLLEDLPSDIDIIWRSLERAGLEFERMVIETRKDFIQALNEFSPDIILADHSLPSFNSHEALIILTATNKKIPFILITSTMSEEFAVDAIKRGADDYIIKDRLSRLPAAINSSLEKFRIERERQFFLNEVIKKEKYYRALIENSADVVLLLNQEGKPTYSSPSLYRILGYTDAAAKHLIITHNIHPDDQPHAAQKMRECLASAGIAIRVGIMRVKHKNGKWVPMDATLTNMLHDPHINGIINNFWDVTEIRIAEQKVLNANRLYAFISQINQLIVHAKDEQELFNEACRIAIDQGKFKMAWIGITDISTTKINLIASRGIPETEIKAITDQSYDSNGPIEKTLNGLDYFVVNDMMSEEGISMHKYAVDQGIHSGISLAVKRSGQTIGSFTIYSTEINFFNEAEIALLKEAIADISFALDIFEKEKQKLVSDELLMHNELHLNQAQAIAHLGSWELDFATGIAVWSAEMLRIYGLSPQESHQSFEAWTNFIHPEDQDRVLQIIRKAYVTFNNASFTYRIIRKDGTVKHLSSESRFEFDPAGNPAGLYGTTLDVTERKLAEEELKASAEELRTTSERLLLATTSAKMGIWDWDIVTDRMTWDNRMYELYGIGKQHFTGAVSVWQNGVHPDDIERADKELNDAIKGISDFNSEFRVIWPDQSVHFIEANGIVSRNEEGVGIRMIGGNVDITERKLAEERVMELNEKVAKSEKFFKGVIENSDDMITILDPDGKTIYASPAVSKKFGYTNEECLNLNLADVVHPDDALIMQEFVMKIMMNPGLPMECPLIRNLKKDGTYIWVEGTLTNFLETEGINALVANFRNITERKKA
ncbi:MAG: PAS domain-containing protein, partial [Bacteroidia bacterium]